MNSFTLSCLTSCLFIVAILGDEADEECMLKFKNCFLDRNCESRINSLDFYCCKAAFNGTEFQRPLEEKCLDERMLNDVSDCIEYLSEKCKASIENYFEERLSNFTAVEKELEIAIGEPTSIEDCGDYVKRIEKEECLLCSDKDENDDAYGFICSIIYSTRESLYCTKENKCVELFSNCLASNIVVKELDEVDERCCKDVINKPGDFYKNKDNCAENETMPHIIRCFHKDEHCQYQIINYFQKNEDLIKEFEKMTIEKTGIPEDESKCSEYYEKEKRIMLEECLLNNDKNLIPFCQLLEKVILRKDSLNYIRDGIENVLKK